MSLVSARLIEEHRECDDHFVEAEAAAAGERWDEACRALEAYITVMERHLAFEEDVLFPRLEAKSADACGPSRVMRLEHDEMRSLMSAMRRAAVEQDRERYMSLSEMVLIMMQQHNLKEERILYPMIDQLLGAEAELLIGSPETAG